MGPCVTDNGNFIVDVQFTGAFMSDPASLHVTLKLLPGVVETGLFVHMAHKGVCWLPPPSLISVFFLSSLQLINNSSSLFACIFYFVFTFRKCFLAWKMGQCRL